MKQLLYIAALAAVAIARPELYKEDEEFQYTRSSSDDGTKAGFYGARRGNMGGNYEKAHNMDHLAQNQMSGLVSQVNGELGDSAKLRAGDVFAGGNSRGVYGSSSYDLSNLQGRNFQEGERVGFGDTHSAFASQNIAGHQSSGYNSHSASSQYNGYQGTKSAQALHSANLQATGEAVGDYGYGRQSGYSSGHSSQYGYQRGNVVPANRLIATTPVKLVMRPGSTVAVPVGVQNYDTAHASHSSIMDHNTINTEAEVLAVPDHVIYKPSSNSKYYESSSNYQKHWEKHDIKPDVMPLAIPTENPFPKNSDLYDDAQALHTSALDYGSIANSYNSNTKSASSQYQSAHNQFASGLNSNTRGAYVGGIADSTNGLGSGTNAKSHSSSYSYHKSWERQGDPYVITPVVGVDTESQRLTAGDQGFASHHYGAHTKSAHQRYYQANGEECDCDENGHLRVPRSVHDDFTQQTQDQWGHLPQPPQIDQQGSANFEYLGQEYQKEMSDLTQQIQNDMEHEGKRTSKNFEELAQQTKRQWDDLRAQTQNNWAREGDRNREMYRQMGQQTQKQWEDLSRQTQQKWDHQRQRTAKNLEEFGQETQNTWGDLTQQSQSGWNTHHKMASEKLEDFGQQSQDKWEDLTQQAQKSWDGGLHKADQKLENVDQQVQTDFGQQTQVNWDAEDKRTLNSSLMDTVQKPKNPWYKEDLGQIVDTPDLVIDQRKKYEDEQQIPVSIRFDTHGTQKYEGFSRQFDNVDWRLYQPHYDDQNEEKTLQTPQSWDNFFHQSNLNKDLISDALTPKLNSMWQHWGQTEDDAKQENYDSFFATEQQSQWKPIPKDSGKQYSQSESEFGYRKQQNYIGISQDRDSSQQPQGSLIGLWDKIQSFDQASSFYSSDEEHKLKNSSSLWPKQSISQSSYNARWGVDQSRDNNSTAKQNLYQKSSNGRIPEYNPWISMIGDSGMLNYHQKSTTIKSNDETTITNLRPDINQDIGRGDIDENQISYPILHTDISLGDKGSDDTYTIKTTNKISVSSGIEGFPTFTEDKKREKTAKEIEALSLTRNIDSQSNEPKRFETAFVHSQDSSELKVMGIEKQERRTSIASGMRRNKNNLNYTEEFRNIANSQPRNTEKLQPRNTESTQIGENSTQAVSPSNNQQNSLAKPSLQNHYKILQNEYQDDEEEKKILQQKSEYEHNYEQSETQFENFEQTSNFNHQLHDARGQNVDDFGEEEQTAWMPEELETQQTEQLPKSNTYKYQNKDFYNQHFKNHTASERLQAETLITLAPIEPVESTVKPGFWKTVGSKLTSAKDKVASWFKQN